MSGVDCEGVAIPFAPPMCMRGKRLVSSWIDQAYDCEECWMLVTITIGQSSTMGGWSPCLYNGRVDPLGGRPPVFKQGVYLAGNALRKGGLTRVEASGGSRPRWRRLRRRGRRCGGTPPASGPSQSCSTASPPPLCPAQCPRSPLHTHL